MIEQFLNANVPEENHLVIEATAIVDPDLGNDIKFQQQAYQIITVCSRQILKAELETIHHKLVQNPKNRSFWTQIHNIFQKS